MRDHSAAGHLPRARTGRWPNYAARPATPHGANGDAVARNVEEIARIESRDRLRMSRSDRVADRITAFSGSMLFVALHVLWFAAWLVLNMFPGAWDPPPFGVLTLIVSLEAIFLSTFVLISQNRQALQADRRARLDLQVNLIAEQEITKLIELLRDVREQVGVDRGRDPQLDQMQRETNVEEIVQKVDEAGERTDANAARGPGSAADTEA